MYNQSEFSNIEDCPVEKKYSKKITCEQTLNTYTFTGTVEFKKHRFKKVSFFLINTFDAKFLEIMSKVFLLLCITAILATTVNFLGHNIADWFYIMGLTSSMVPLIFSIGLQSVLEYYHDTFCKKCQRKLACEETDEPVMKEISSLGDYTLTVKRHWKCRYCGNVDIREGPDNIFARKGEMLPSTSLKSTMCKKCSGIGTVIEVKKPDIKDIGKKKLTRRYYKCALCGNEDINGNEETATRSTCIGR